MSFDWTASVDATGRGEDTADDPGQRGGLFGDREDDTTGGIDDIGIGGGIFAGPRYGLMLLSPEDIGGELGCCGGFVGTGKQKFCLIQGCREGSHEKHHPLNLVPEKGPSVFIAVGRQYPSGTDQIFAKPSISLQAMGEKRFLVWKTCSRPLLEWQALFKALGSDPKLAAK